jgi:hypothetical protein
MKSTQCKQILSRRRETEPATALFSADFAAAQTKPALSSDEPRMGR